VKLLSFRVKGIYQKFSKCMHSFWKKFAFCKYFVSPGMSDSVLSYFHSDGMLSKLCFDNILYISSKFSICRAESKYICNREELLLFLWSQKTHFMPVIPDFIFIRYANTMQGFLLMQTKAKILQEKNHEWKNIQCIKI